MPRFKRSTAVEVTGMVVVVAGLGLISVPAAVVVGGLLLVYISYGLSKK